VQISEALNPRRIARSLSVVLLLTLLETVVAPVIVPTIIAPKAHAVTATITPASNSTGAYVTIPAGVSSVTIDAFGGTGGKGGNDGNIGTNGGAVGRVTATFAVTPGDVLSLYAGNAGVAGSDGAQNAGGGTGGADTLPNSAFSINGTYYGSIDFGGGTGGNAGTSGSSGGGGGAGAATVVAINSAIVVVAGGGGGGGGAGNGSSYAASWNGIVANNGTNTAGGTGTFGAACGSTDGGGGGGGGGGYYAGAGGAAPKIVNECAGVGGSRGSNLIVGATSTTTDGSYSSSGAGAATYTYNYDAVTTCAKVATVVDIYTVEKISNTGNCTWSVPANVSVVDLFLVGGGAGGAGDGGGGGGGGAALSRTAIAVTPNSTLTLKSGYGGAGGSWGYIFGAVAGDSTTVTLASGVTYAALGGVAGSMAPSGAGGAGGTAANGGFAGGAGGAGGSCFNVGAAGKTGISNYFYGSKSEYGGGGGGGSCPNGAATTGALGASGGGAGGYAISATLNAPGSNGSNGTGAGGGGGVATGTGLKVSGGKGASGVILIRYATDSANAFPSTLTSSLYSRWVPSDLQVLDSAREAVVDSAGRSANGAVTGSPYIYNRGTSDGANSTQSTKTLMTMKGATTDSINLANLPSDNYTMFHVARYVTGGSTGRLFSANSGNWISGFYSGQNGCAHHNSWLTPSGCDPDNLYGWELSMDQLYYYRHNGEDVSMDRDGISTQSRSDTFGINNYWNGQKADWEVADVIVFDRKLTAGEIRQMEAYLARIYGLSLSQASGSDETDTAVTFGGTYYYGQYNTGFSINDTFTLEAWVKPGTSCTTSYCSLFSYENVLVTKIESGRFFYALYGVNTAWVWTDTGFTIPANEWHHISMVKKLPGSQANAIEFYVDGQLVYTDPNSPYSGAAATNSLTDVVRTYDTWYYLGVRANEGANFSGAMDEFKLWKVARTASQIQDDMHSNDATSSNLQLYYDFNVNAASYNGDLRGLAYGGPARTDLVSAGGAKTFNDVKITTKSSAYTTITFPRTYITQSGGWKVPESVTAASTIVVGGGGGGGYGGSSNAPAGAGGGGGVTASLTQNYTPNSIVSIKVGQGGLGGFSTDDASLRNGQSSTLGVAGMLTALGGGGGGNFSSGAGGGGATLATGGGSGGSSVVCNGSGPYTPSGSVVAGGTVPSGYNGAGGIWGWGGSGGGARGAATNGDCNGSQAGIPGAGYVDPITSIEYGRGGSATSYSTTSGISGNTIQNNGWGGVVSYNGGNSNGNGYRGSSGTIVIRYITATKPAYTQPTNAYLNVGMTETFTTNVAQDSATAGLTRTFRWESTTAGSGGTYMPIKVGTGAANAAFSWVPSDTSTTGSQFLYRVVVTDSDTVGLFTVDTSTPVFAVINDTLKMSGATSIKKQINVARNETFTISAGTPSYRYTLTPTIPGVTLDTSTVGTTILKISDTASVGTYLETLTVTDSVSASVVIPLTVAISAPPTLINGGEVISNGQILNIDPGNSASYNIASGAISDISGTKKTVLSPNGATYSSDYSGVLSFATGSSQYLSATAFTQYNAWTIETWIRLDSAPSAHFCPLTSEYAPTNISFELCVDSTRTFYAGFHNGVWTYKRSNEVIPVGTWTHLVGTFDGTAINVYINGVPITVKDSSTSAGLTPPQPSTNRIFINKDYATAIGTTPSATYGPIRMYNVGFTQADVTKNYNATKDRFATTNLSQIKPAQKYGTLNLESFTVTSGGDTKTITFAVGDRLGIDWDTSTAGIVKLIVQESLTPGTYYDTITVTDNFAQSTLLPIKFTVNKADTLTVYIDTPTALNYTGNRAIFTSTVKTTGAVGLESGTVLSVTTKFKPAGTSCATGGYCRVGDIGPGGGIVFIDTSTASSDGRIYEVAPQNWSGSDDLSTVATYCSNNNLNLGATQTGIGWGETNTNLAKISCLGGAVGKVNSFNLSNNTGYSDWFIPSRYEAVELAKIPATAGLLNIGSNWTVGNWGYWASTEVSSSVMWSIGHTGATFAGNANVLKSEAYRNMVRPIRAFRPCWAIDTCTSLATTDTPTAAGIYVISPSNAVNSSDLAARYTTVSYVDSRLTINRIAQRAQVIPFVNTNYPETYTVNVTEGSGNGAVTYSTVNGTASGCAFDYKKLYTTSQGTCTVTIVKAGDRNYLPDTATAGILFLSFVLNQPAPATGSGPGIALSGQTAVTLDANAAPTITGLSTYTAVAGQTQLIISGAGFDHNNLAGITVKFWRNQSASGFTVNSGDSQITVTVPAGATTGKVIVTTPNGQAVSELALTVTAP
jgi:hypothetical protein